MQIFITNRCNLRCKGCFARHAMEGEVDISTDEYKKAVKDGLEKGVKQINLLGGEPLVHPQLGELLAINRRYGLKTSVYTNGYFLDKYDADFWQDAKLRVSLYCKAGGVKAVDNLPDVDCRIDVCYMVSRDTTVEELLATAQNLEENYNCPVFFISSIRELDNPNREFFDDTDITMNLLDYKKLVHEFLEKYEGNMEVHVSKRGVFESLRSAPHNRCLFANYFIGGKVIQCPFDVVNLKFQKDYSFDSRHCRQSSTCLMSKVIYKPKK